VTFIEELKDFLEKHNIEYDPKYLELIQILVTPNTNIPEG
jgi:predicted house-cleaning noncanonical NTP pyrophosphatase (MazG superfamily)